MVHNILFNDFEYNHHHEDLKGQLQGHTAMLAARQERGKRGK